MFENVAGAAKLLGDYEINVKWFDGEAKEVARPMGVGRYGVVIEVVSDDLRVKRGHTFYGLPRGVDGAGLLGEMDGAYLEKVGLDKGLVGDVERLNRFEQSWWQEDVLMKQWRRARLLGALHAWGEMKKGGGELAEWITARVMDSDYLLKVKLTEAGLSGKTNQRIEGPTAMGESGGDGVVREGRLAEARFKEGFKEAIGEVCEQWADEGGVPFTVMVVRDGVIAYRGAHGPKGIAAIDERTRFDVASISKLLFSSMLSMARYEGLIGLDDGLGLYLKGFANEGEKLMTVRMCMMHVAGRAVMGVMAGWGICGLSRVCWRRWAGCGLG